MDLDSSLEKILHSGEEFGDLFYDIFFERHPAAKKFFEGSNMEGQALMLAMSLKLMSEYRAHGYPAVKHYLKHLGTRHSDRGVPREIYPKWIDSLLVALERFHGKDWTDALAKEWREALDGMSKVMFDGYNRRVGF